MIFYLVVLSFGKHIRLLTKFKVGFPLLFFIRLCLLQFFEKAILRRFFEIFWKKSYFNTIRSHFARIQSHLKVLDF